MLRNLMSYKALWIMLGALGVLSLSGCATIVSGTTQKLNVETTPSGATAKVSNGMSAQTPTVFVLERKRDYSIEISKDGYKTVNVMLRRTFNGMMTGNLLLGGIIGGGVDAVSGASNKIVPERINLVLEEGQGIAEMPKFSAPKDQEFYEKSILKLNSQPGSAANPKVVVAEEVKVEPATNFTPTKAV